MLDIEEVLEELHNVRPELLNDKTRRLFDAIMSIADERDLYKQRIDKAIEKLYLLGETLNPEFQKEMLEILKGENND